MYPTFWTKAQLFYFITFFSLFSAENAFLPFIQNFLGQIFSKGLILISPVVGHLATVVWFLERQKKWNASSNALHVVVYCQVHVCGPKCKYVDHTK